MFKQLAHRHPEKCALPTKVRKEMAKHRPTISRHEEPEDQITVLDVSALLSVAAIILSTIAIFW